MSRLRKTAPLGAGAAAFLAALACWGAGAAEATGSAVASAAEPCEFAHALYAAGYFGQAEQTYKRLRGVAPCATTTLVIEARAAAESQAGVSKEQLVQALRLQGAGFEEEARKLLKMVAQNSTTPIPARLRTVDQQMGWWRGVLGTVGPWVRLGLEILAVLFGVFLVGLFIITGGNALAARIKRSARLAGFEGSSEATLGPVLSAALSQVLTRMSDDTPGPRVDWQSGTEPKFKVPSAIAEATPPAGILAGLVEMLDGMLYRRQYIVSGTVHPVHQHRGAGLTLAVAKRNGRTLSRVTIWERDFMLKEAGVDASDAVRYERLILPAAVWLSYRKELGFSEGNKLPLNTRNWRSYALFALGELVPDPAKERRLYEMALDLDAYNLGARLNLAALLLRRPDYAVSATPGQGQAADESSRESWDESRKAAWEHLCVVAKHTKPYIDPIWYRARYMQAITCIYCAQGARARTLLCELRREMGHHCQRPYLRKLIDALRQPIAVMECTTWVIEGTDVEIPPEASREWFTATAEYNLACLWSRRVETAPNCAERNDRTVRALRSLRRAMDRNEHAVREAKVDPAFDPIRCCDGFQALLQQDTPVGEPEQQKRYAITLDPGPALLGLVKP